MTSADATTPAAPSTTGAPAWDADAFRAAVQRELEAFVDLQAARLADLGSDAAELLEAAREAVSGGKRLRAMFCWWGFHAVAVPTPDEVGPLVRAGAALELLHASALVHDDVMDASDTRRGHPAAHKAFESRHRAAGWRGPAQQYGEAAAVLLGDLLLCWSDELLRTCGLPRERVVEALGWFDLTRSEVIAGQFLDVSVQARGTSTVEEAMRVLRYKSAGYSVERPLHVGAALAGATPDDLAALSAYGVPLGEAFQLRDDILGVYGDPEVTGKPAGDDLSEGKRTVLVALALEGAPPAAAAHLDERLGQPLDHDEVAALRRTIDESGAHAEVERRIEALTQACLAALDAAPFGAEAQDALRRLAAAATQRAL